MVSALIILLFIIVGAVIGVFVSLIGYLFDPKDRMGFIVSMLGFYFLFMIAFTVAMVLSFD